MIPARGRVILRDDPDEAFEGAMDFRLTYEGVLMGASKSNTRASHKHDIRRVFHSQLKRLWSVEPYLKTALYSHRASNPPAATRPRLNDYLANQYERLGYKFVPLVNEWNRLYCSLDILFLRPSMPGDLMRSGDLDNRLKTLFDALRMPQNKDELGGYENPQEGEEPFYCLLTDDKLITKVAVETDLLLQPTAPEVGDNDSRLVISVQLKPYDMGWDNISFT